MRKNQLIQIALAVAIYRDLLFACYLPELNGFKFNHYTPILDKESLVNLAIFVR